MYPVGFPADLDGDVAAFGDKTVVDGGLLEHDGAASLQRAVPGLAQHTGRGDTPLKAGHSGHETCLAGGVEADLPGDPLGVNEVLSPQGGVRAESNGATVIHFGPTVILWLYGPLKSWFDPSWRPGELGPA
ncbi:hypothetical protein ACH4CD_27015 [Streptomyces fungicidicus]|uniref:hypothetical protein n=1 Tax=Streptomyces fungicidicus TaxID=68203 RepID=UPI0037A62664